MTFQFTKTDMLIEALEYYVYKLKEDNCNQAAIDVFTDLLNELESSQSDTFGPTGLIGDPQ
jgi:hypothetical protein